MRTQCKGGGPQATEGGLGRNGPAETLISDFQPPERGEINFGSLSLLSVVVCYGSPRRLMQGERKFSLSVDIKINRDRPIGIQRSINALSI